MISQYQFQYRTKIKLKIKLKIKPRPTLDPFEIPLINIQKLPQRSIVKTTKKKVTRRSIITLFHIADKRKIVKSLDNLTAFIQLRKEKSSRRTPYAQSLQKSSNLYLFLSFSRNSTKKLMPEFTK